MLILTTTVTIEDANNSALDLTNYTAAASLRKSYKSSSSTSFTVAFVIQELLDRLRYH